jgi:hypothetical protein
MEALLPLAERRVDVARRSIPDLLQRGLLDAVRATVTAALQQPEGQRWADDLIGEAITWRNLAHADALVRLIADLRQAPLATQACEIPAQDSPRLLSAGKLIHDIEQFEWLDARGLLGGYSRALRQFEGQHGEHRVPLEQADEPLVQRYFGRLLHLADGERVAQALSDSWRGASAEALYLDEAPGIVVIDNFLSADALIGLRHFCLASTFWNANRYGHGRLGAFVRDGFSCPLLFQIAEELRARLPRVLDQGLLLKQLWGFKNAAHQPADAAIHADFAAVNVNFWLTPTEANINALTGGMSIFAMDAPPDWDFEMYNARTDLIHDFLQRNGARRIRIPYRANRAIIFNSDLFHGTDRVDFSPCYENRRINVTFLYGNRENDLHHHQVSAPISAWRSAAFRRAR